jgi:hypothetical protein
MSNISTARPRASFLDIITMIAVVLGVVYGALEVRQFRQAREREGVLELQRTVQTPEYIRAIAFLIDLPDTTSVEEIRRLRHAERREDILRLIITWESLGISVYRRDVPIAWVDEYYRFAVMTSWRKLGPWIKDERERRGYSGLGEWFQWLAERLDGRHEDADVPAYERHRDWRE